MTLGPPTTISPSSPGAASAPSGRRTATTTCGFTRPTVPSRSNTLVPRAIVTPSVDSVWPYASISSAPSKSRASARFASIGVGAPPTATFSPVPPPAATEEPRRERQVGRRHEGRHAGRRGRVAGDGLPSTIAEERPGPRMLEQVCRLLGRRADGDRHGDGPDPPDGEEHRHHRGLVRRLHADRLSRPEPPPHEPRRQLVDGGGELPVGDAPAGEAEATRPAATGGLQREKRRRRRQKNQIAGT